MENGVQRRDNNVDRRLYSNQPESPKKYTEPKEPSGPSHHNSTHHSEEKTRPQPDPAHAPQTGQQEATTYVLTLQASKPLHNAVNEIRRKYFPAQINKTPAHITLFHALPGSCLASIMADLNIITASHKSFPIQIGPPWRMKHGVGITGYGLEPAKKLYSEFQEKWWDWLSQQDRGGMSRHWTVMNKVEDQDKVGEAYEELTKWNGIGMEGTAEGVMLWRFDRGYWRFVRTYHFGGE